MDRQNPEDVPQTQETELSNDSMADIDETDDNYGCGNRMPYRCEDTVLNERRNVSEPRHSKPNASVKSTKPEQMSLSSTLQVSKPEGEDPANNWYK